MRLERPGFPLFVQFKTSDFMTGRSDSREIREGYFSGPFYRMHLRPLRRSPQHQLLLDLETQGDNEVYYIAPLFHEREHLNEAYLSRSVLPQSIFMPPSFIGPLPDNGDHYVAFQNAQVEEAIVFSRPKPIRALLNFEEFLKRLEQKLKQHRENSYESFLPVRSHLIHILAGMMSDPRYIRLITNFQPNAADHVAFMAWTYLDCNIFLVQPREPQTSVINRLTRHRT